MKTTALRRLEPARRWLLRAGLDLARYLTHQPAVHLMKPKYVRGPTATREWNRELKWLSSVTGDPAALAELEQRMNAFYSWAATREKYQAMIDAEGNMQPETERAMCKAVLERQPTTILEVGCGSGRIYRQLRTEGFKGAYTGLDISADVIERNRMQCPEAVWVCGSIYDAALPQGPFDAICAYFVLEHCVYPARALERMLSVLRANGTVTLVFPDCVMTGRLGSQALGFVQGRASERLRKGDIVNALFNLYESRVRLPRALRLVVKNVGPFPVNLNPRCLHDPECMEPDVDQVYISSAREVGDWADERGLWVEFPAGTEGNVRASPLIQLTPGSNRIRAPEE